MSDEDVGNALEDMGEDNFKEAKENKSSKGLSKTLVKLLTYIVGGLIGIILVVTIVVITVKFLDRGDQAKTFKEVSEEYQGKTAPYLYFEAIKQIRTRTADKAAHSVSVKVDIGYNEGDEKLATELTARIPQLTDLIRTYFSGKTAEEMNADEQAVKDELRERINAVLTNGRVENIIFTEYQTFEF
ncbi:MAG: flagellar basal body-associated FliL family protein [Spirochaetaceae bacterium]|jgi:flagellar basal body-associated protein FliL|nr:flagellar basal body-associated FliL family protein [Spirochaetaceae bacterium]